MIDMSKIKFEHEEKENALLQWVYGFKTNKGLYIRTEVNEECAMLYISNTRNSNIICFIDDDNYTIKQICEIYGEELIKVYYHSEDLKITIEEK